MTTTTGRNTPTKHLADVPGIRVVKRGTCPICGKDASRQDRIPVLRDDRTRRPYPEVKADEAEWLAEPVIQVGCQQEQEVME